MTVDTALPMTCFPFAEVRFPPEGRSQAEVQSCLRRHYQRLRAIRDGIDPPIKADGAINETGWLDRLDDIDIPWSARRRLQHRAACLATRSEVISGLWHRARKDRERLEVFREGAKPIRIPSENPADEIAAGIHAGMPGTAQATETVWHAMRRSVREGWPGLRVSPVLLDGPPGIGKSHWVRLPGTALAAPTTVIEVTGKSASFAVVGSQRGWGNAYPGRVLEPIVQSRAANPVPVVDEAEKAGAPASMKDMHPAWHGRCRRCWNR